MRSIRTVAILCVVATSWVGIGPNAPGNRFGIGATPDQNSSGAGNPEMLYWAGDHKFHEFSEELTLLQIDPRVDDIYERASGGNTFRIELTYGVDTSTSRLHPVARVSRIRFTPDHAAPFRSLMNEIPEVVALCTDGCAMGGVIMGTMPEVHACRSPKYPNELEIMAAAASGWLPNHDQEFVYEYCVRVTFEETSASYQLAPGQTWDNLTVDQIEVGPGLDPRTDKLVAMGAGKEYDLGTWTPGSSPF
jgi:hypothetical protein